MDKINDTGTNGRPVALIPYTDGNEEFSHNITAAEIEGMKDTSGDIRFHKVMEHLLPTFEDIKGKQQLL